MIRLVLAALLAFPMMAAAQNQPGWFVPGQPQGQGQSQGQRPAQPATPQRPAQPAQAVAPLPPGTPPPAAVIGVVDVPEIQRVSTAFNQVRQEIERRRAKLNDDVQNEQQRWRDEQQRLGNERAALSPEQLRTRERTLQDQITDGQRIFRDRARDLEQLAQQALREIEQALAIVIRQVAASRNINLVLPRPLIIYNEPAFDMTEDVAVQLNRMISAVNLPPDPAASPPPRPTATPAPAPAAPRRN
ncbi:MAG: OmpH family outer membrane protein [Acetobacteraceae bacterium]|jgi:Skp family chaperone for outer membrane proteins|nr:OmpH family outer membrane protein [Acetobacteraceae bacterium]